MLKMAHLSVHRPFDKVRARTGGSGRVKVQAAALHHVEPVGDEGEVGVAGIGGRVGAGAVEVGDAADWLT